MTILNTMTRKLSNSKGNKRVWEENYKLLSKSGFSIGDHISIEYFEDRIEITKDDNGKNIISKRNDKPIVDIANRKVEVSLGGADKVVHLFYRNKLVISLTGIISKATERLKQIKRRLNVGAPIAVASLFAGIAGLDLAVAEGLQKAGIESRLAWANEYDTTILETSLENNPVWKHSSKAFGQPIQEFSPSQLNLESPDVLLAGMPCIGQSSMQTDKMKRGVFHPTSGLLFVDFLRVVHESNPAVIWLEQSPNFLKKTFSPESFGTQHVDHYVIERYLTELGYNITYKKVNGLDHGLLEKRQRTLLVAVTDGLDFDINEVEVPSIEARPLGQYLDDFNDIPDKAWSEMKYLSDKTKEKGNNFSETLVHELSTRIPVFTATYAKRQPNTPIISNKFKPNLKRIATPQEHARIKHFPESLVEGCNMTIGHRALGNSVQKPVFSHYSEHMGKMLLGQISEPTINYIIKPKPRVMATSNVTRIKSISEVEKKQMQLF